MTSSSPLISIVIPVKDRADIVARTLDSVFAQTYRPLRLIIVDNASTDSTPKVLGAWAASHDSDRFRVSVISESRPGAAAARNAGLAAVTTPYVMFFDSDDIMLPSHVGNVAEAISRHPEAKLIYWDVAVIDSDGWMTLKRPHPGSLLRSHILHGTLSTQRIVVSTEHARFVGGWDRSLRQWDDLEFGLRLLLPLESESVHYLTGEPTVRIFPQADSLTGPDYSSVSHNLLTALDHLSADIDRSGLEVDKQRILQQLVDMRRADVAGHLAREGDRTEATSIMQEILQSAPVLRDALLLRMTFLTVRLFGRGGFLLAPDLPKSRD